MKKMQATNSWLLFSYYQFPQMLGMLLKSTTIAAYTNLKMKNFLFRVQKEHSGSQ